MMTRSYLFINAMLYSLLAIWCTIQHNRTSAASGFETLNNSGHSEYLVIYGGLQLGLAVFYAHLGSQTALHRTGVLFSVMLYVPIVVYRVMTILHFSPVSKITLGTGALELGLLVGAVALLIKTPAG